MHVDMDEESFADFVSYKTHFEIYLPCTSSWKERVFLSGRKIRKAFLGCKVEIVSAGASHVSVVKGADIRYVPIRPTERTGKHIVLFIGQ